MNQTKADREIVVATLTFEGDGDISSREFVLFLNYFRAAYVAFANNVNFSVERIRDQEEELTEKAKKFLASFKTDEAVVENISTDCGQNELIIVRISKNSPLEIVVTGIAVALVMAVIFSGGEIHVLGMRAKLPPLGKDVQELRKAFGLKERK